MKKFRSFSFYLWILIFKILLSKITVFELNLVKFKYWLNKLLKMELKNKADENVENGEKLMGLCYLDNKLKWY